MAKKKDESRVKGRRQRTIYLPEYLDKRVRIRAAQLDTTVSVVIAQALRAFFAAERAAVKRTRKTP